MKKWMMLISKVPRATVDDVRRMLLGLVILPAQSKELLIGVGPVVPFCLHKPASDASVRSQTRFL
eukprot:6181304-Pleurochrysis_carterae.AAC.1